MHEIAYKITYNENHAFTIFLLIEKDNLNRYYLVIAVKRSENKILFIDSIKKGCVIYMYTPPPPLKCSNITF